MHFDCDLRLHFFLQTQSDDWVNSLKPREFCEEKNKQSKSNKWIPVSSKYDWLGMCIDLVFLMGSINGLPLSGVKLLLEQMMILTGV